MVTVCPPTLIPRRKATYLVMGRGGVARRALRPAPARPPAARRRRLRPHRLQGVDHGLDVDLAGGGPGDDAHLVQALEPGRPQLRRRDHVVGGAVGLADADELDGVGAVPAPDDDHRLHPLRQLDRLILGVQRPAADAPPVLVVVGLRPQHLHQLQVVGLQHGGLGDGGQLLEVGQVAGLGRRFDDHPPLGVGHGGLRLRVVAVPEDDHLVALPLQLHRDLLHRGDDGAGGVHHVEAKRAGPLEGQGALAVGPHEDGLPGHARGHVRLPQGAHAEPFQLLHGRGVVDQLAGEEDRPLGRPGGLDGAIPGPLDAPAEPHVGLRSHNSHARAVTPCSTPGV